MRSSSRRSAGRGTAVDSETVVDSNAASASDWPASGRFPADQRCKHAVRAPLEARNSRQNGTLWTLWLKERFFALKWSAVPPRPASRERVLNAAAAPAADRRRADARGIPRERRARRAASSPSSPSDDEEFRAAFLAQRPDMVALDLGMPGMDGVELIRFLADQNYRRAGADRQRLRPASARIRVPARRGARPRQWSARSRSRCASRCSKRC